MYMFSLSMKLTSSNLMLFPTPDSTHQSMLYEQFFSRPLAGVA